MLLRKPRCLNFPQSQYVESLCVYHLTASTFYQKLWTVISFTRKYSLKITIDIIKYTNQKDILENRNPIKICK